MIVVALAVALVGACVATVLSSRADVARAGLRTLMLVAVAVPLGASRVVANRRGVLLAVFVAGVAINALVSVLQSAGLELFAGAQITGRTDTGAFLGNEGHLAQLIALATVATALVAWRVPRADVRIAAASTTVLFVAALLDPASARRRLEEAQHLRRERVGVGAHQEVPARLDLEAARGERRRDDRRSARHRLEDLQRLARARVHGSDRHRGAPQDRPEIRHVTRDDDRAVEPLERPDPSVRSGSRHDEARRRMDAPHQRQHLAHEPLDRIDVREVAEVAGEGDAIRRAPVRCEHRGRRREALEVDAVRVDREVREIANRGAIDRRHYGGMGERAAEPLLVAAEAPRFERRREARRAGIPARPPLHVQREGVDQIDDDRQRRALAMPCHPRELHVDEVVATLGDEAGDGTPHGRRFVERRLQRTVAEHAAREPGQHLGATERHRHDLRAESFELRARGA